MAGNSDPPHKKVNIFRIDNSSTIDCRVLTVSYIFLNICITFHFMKIFN